MFRTQIAFHGAALTVYAPAVAASVSGSRFLIGYLTSLMATITGFSVNGRSGVTVLITVEMNSSAE